MKRFVLSSLTLLLFAINTAAQRYDAEEYEFGVQIVGLPDKASKDSTSLSFDKLNKPLIQDIQERLSHLPVNRCKTPLLTVSLGINSEGGTETVRLRQATGNPKQDSMIIRTIRQFPGTWKEVPPEIADGRSMLTVVFVLPMVYEKAHYTSSDPGSSPSAYMNDRCKDADHFYNEGVRELKEQKLPRALRNFRSANELNPYDLDCLFNLAVVYFKSNEPEKACDCLQKAVSYGDARSVETYQKYCETTR